MSTDKNKAVKNWLLKCPEIQADRLYFNFLKADENSHGFITNNQDRAKKDIMGNQIGKYNFSIIDFRLVSKSPVSLSDEDLNKMADVQKILDWVKDTKERPDFGEGTLIDEIYPLSDSPDFAMADPTETPDTAKYTVAIQIEYVIFNV